MNILASVQADAQGVLPYDYTFDFASLAAGSSAQQRLRVDSSYVFVARSIIGRAWYPADVANSGRGGTPLVGEALTVGVGSAAGVVTAAQQIPSYDTLRVEFENQTKKLANAAQRWRNIIAEWASDRQLDFDWVIGAGSDMTWTLYNDSSLFGQGQAIQAQIVMRGLHVPRDLVGRR